MHEIPDPEDYQPAGLEDPSQSPLVQAFQVAIKTLQDEADTARKSARWRTAWIVVLGIVCIGLAVTGALATYGVIQVRSATQVAEDSARQAQATSKQIEQGALNSCLDGNAYRAGTVLAIDRLVTLLVNGSKDPATLKAARDYEAYVLSVNAPRNCYAIYHVTPPKAAPSAGTTGPRALP